MSEFLDIVKKAAEKFKDIDKKLKFRVVSHLDADGISAAAIISKLLHYMQVDFTVSVIKQLDRMKVKHIATTEYDVFIFTDLGAGNIIDIEEHFKEKIVFVLDHHKPKDQSKDIVMVNPHLIGIDGSKSISGSGVSYYFAKEIDERIKNMAHIALIGAIGDIQEDNGFMELNDAILKDAIDEGNIKIERGIRFLSYRNRALHKLLEYCNEPSIEGITGNEKNAIEFLKKLGIYSDGWKNANELNNEEVRKLSEAIAELINVNVEDIMCNNYVLTNEREDSLKEAREFATVLNACGRMGHSSIGIGACLGDEEMKKKAIECLEDYRKEIVKAMEWFKANKGTGNIIEKDKFMIINAKDKIIPTIIGTLASMITKSNIVKEGTYVLAMARLIEGTTKSSLRFAGKRKDVDLREIVKEIIENLKSGEYGGHKNAAGTLVETEKEAEFLSVAKDVLEKRSLEEDVV
jgi:RecJ-like exonuclease